MIDKEIKKANESLEKIIKKKIINELEEKRRYAFNVVYKQAMTDAIKTVNKFLS